MLNLKRALATTAILATTAMLGIGSSFAEGKTARVLHFWTSGGESAAVNEVKVAFEAKDFEWQDLAIASNGVAEAMVAFRAMVNSGDIPEGLQVLGYDIFEWSDAGILADVDVAAERGNWDQLVPDSVKKFTKIDGHWKAVPFGIHSTNWIYVNKALLAKLDATEPKSFDELLVLLKKAKDAGIIPMAQGLQPWQEAQLFDNVLISTQGLDFYRQVFHELDYEAMGSEKMVAAFAAMSQLREYTDPNLASADWNEATAKVISGDALMHSIGDWAKGEFTAANKVPGVDYDCFRFPGTDGTVVMISDLMSFPSKGENANEAQIALAETIMDPQVQVAFSKAKGSVPSRIDVSSDDLDVCGKKAYEDFKKASAEGTLVGSMAESHAQKAAMKQALHDVVSRHFHGQLTDEQAAQALVQAIQSAE